MSGTTRTRLAPRKLLYCDCGRCAYCELLRLTLLPDRLPSGKFRPESVVVTQAEIDRARVDWRRRPGYNVGSKHDETVTRWNIALGKWIGTRT